MKKAFFIIITILLFFSCATSKKLDDKKNDLLEKYNKEPNETNAIELGEFFNFAYVNKIENAEEGLKFLNQAMSDYPENYRIMALCGNLYTQLSGLYSKHLDFTKATEEIDKGFRLLDKAVENDPTMIMIHIIHFINAKIPLYKPTTL